jgi:hypothetical protein
VPLSMPGVVISHNPPVLLYPIMLVVRSFHQLCNLLHSFRTLLAPSNSLVSVWGGDLVQMYSRNAVNMLIDYAAGRLEGCLLMGSTQV